MSDQSGIKVERSKVIATLSQEVLGSFWVKAFGLPDGFYTVTTDDCGDGLALVKHADRESGGAYCAKRNAQRAAHPEAPRAELGLPEGVRGKLERALELLDVVRHDVDTPHCGQAYVDATALIREVLASAPQVEPVAPQPWEETARMHARNEEYYRGLLDRIGKALEPAAFTCDDGSVSEDVLRAKVPELVEAALAYRDSARSLENRVAELESYSQQLAQSFDTVNAELAAWRATEADGRFMAEMALRISGSVRAGQYGREHAEAARRYLAALPKPVAPEPVVEPPLTVESMPPAGRVVPVSDAAKKPVEPEQPKAWVPKVGERVLVKRGEYAGCAGRVRFIYPEHIRVTLDAASGALAVISPSFAVEDIEPEPPKPAPVVPDVARALELLLESRYHSSPTEIFDRIDRAIRALGGTP